MYFPAESYEKPLPLCIFRRNLMKNLSRYVFSGELPGKKGHPQHGWPFSDYVLKFKPAQGTLLLQIHAPADPFMSF